MALCYLIIVFFLSPACASRFPPCTHLHYFIKRSNAVLHLHRSSVVAVSHRCPIVPVSLPSLEALFFQRFSYPGSVAVGAECLEKLLLGLLEGHGGHLSLSVGGQGEKLGATAMLAQRAEKTEQVGLGHAGHGQFGPG